MIRYQHELDGVTPARLAGFWEGWPDPPTPRMHLRSLEGSEVVVLAIDGDASDRVVGFVTAVGDGALASYIPLLEVLPDYRGRGIGSELVRRLLERLADRYMVDLVCDEEAGALLRTLRHDPLRGHLRSGVSRAVTSARLRLTPAAIPPNWPASRETRSANSAALRRTVASPSSLRPSSVSMRSSR